jgi:hypothetical protein
LVCNLAVRKPSPHPKGAGAEELSKHPVEIGHDEIEVRFAPISRRLGVDPDVHPGVYFQHILEIPLQPSGLLGKILLDPPSGSARYLMMTVISIRNK